MRRELIVVWRKARLSIFVNHVVAQTSLTGCPNDPKLAMDRARRVPSLPRYKGGTTRLEETAGSVNGAFSSALREFSLLTRVRVVEELVLPPPLLFLRARRDPSLSKRCKISKISSRGIF